MAQFNITLNAEHLHGLFSCIGRDEALAKPLEEMFNQVLLAQSAEQIGAEYYDRTDERTAYRKGTRDWDFSPRVGTLILKILRLRDGQVSIDLFERCQRSE